MGVFLIIVLMVLFKLLCHINSFFWKLYYHLIYGKKYIVGKNFQFRKGFTLLIGGLGGVKIGNDVFFNNYCTICSIEYIEIGDGTIFGENVKIYDNNHKYKDTDVPIKYQGCTTSPIIIGKHCWIGSNVTILKGVKIGDNCVVGAGCVLTKDIPPNQMVLCNQTLLMKEIL